MGNPSAGLAAALRIALPMASPRSFGGLLALALLASAGLVLLGGASASTGAGSGAPRPAPLQADVAVDQGRLLFLQTCASCHGADGGGTQLAPSLKDAGAAAWDFYLRTGRMPLSAPGQPAFRQVQDLTPEQITWLVAFGRTISTGPEIPTVVVDAASLTAGRELYINNCAACHGATGSGGSIGGGAFAPTLIGRSPTIVAEAALVGPGPMPRFDWSEQQLSEVAAYVGYLGHAPSPGGQPLGGYGPVPEGFVAVVIGLGLLVVVCRWIAGTGKRGETPGEPAQPDAQGGEA
jgi:ubiquinol-cytochrome c reductase cytochrome c subunit